jgi:hypothetical protein
LIALFLSFPVFRLLKWVTLRADAGAARNS